MTYSATLYDWNSFETSDFIHHTQQWKEETGERIWDKQVKVKRTYSATLCCDAIFGLFTTIIQREKGRDLTQSYDKSPYTNRNVKRAKWQHKQRHKKFD